MALTETQEYKVEVMPPYCVLQVRRADIILKDGVEIARSYHRHVLNPGADVSKEPKVVQEVAGAVWTQECIDAYTASLPEEEVSTMPAPEEEASTGTADVKAKVSK